MKIYNPLHRIFFFSFFDWWKKQNKFEKRNWGLRISSFFLLGVIGLLGWFAVYILFNAQEIVANDVSYNPSLQIDTLYKTPYMIKKTSF